MSKDCTHNELVLLRNGTAQNQRFIDALSPETVQLFDLSTRDWMQFAFQFSKMLHYFETATNTVSENWENFFVKETEIDDFVEKLQALDTDESTNTEFQSDVDLHLTLFATFLKLTSFSQKRLNKLSKKHLDFYYKEILKLKNKGPKEDKAFMLFELAKNAAHTRIPVGTKMDAGKDSLGNKRIYKTQKELIVNNATVTSLRNIYPHSGVGIKNSFVANSYDGLGEDFLDDNTSWWAFGHPYSNEEDLDSLPQLPFAKTGFGIAAPILNLKEGKRSITFTVTLNSVPNVSLTLEDIINTLSVFFSGEKEWIQGTYDSINSSFASNTLKLVVTLDESIDPIMGYNEEVLLEPYTTTDPVARFLIDYDATDSVGHAVQQLFSKTVVQDINISITVEGLQDIAIENDLGVMDASKPFYPFGTLPVEGSNLFIGLSEVLDKNWENISLEFEWKDKPPSFIDRYVAYREEFVNTISKAFYTLKFDAEGGINYGGTTAIIDDENHFTADVNILKDGVWQEAAEYELFSDNAWDITGNTDTTTTDSQGSSRNMLQRQFGIRNLGKEGIIFQEREFGFTKNPPTRSGEKFTALAKEGFIRVTLNQSFLHKLFPKIFTIALSKTGEEALIPNEPYTPMVETMKVGYTASASYNDIRLFHEQPFGVSEESSALKLNSVLKPSERVITLLPKFAKSALYMAIDNADTLQQINLLVQTLEGSENPETTNDFAEGEKLQWFALCNNEWLSLNNDYIVANDTDNFLKTGVVTLSIPKEASLDNTKFPPGSFWIKVENPRDFDTASQLLDIRAQAVLAQFENNNNSLDHLEYGLEAGTISKLVERLAPIKSITQDFSTFDGAPEETDADYYRRISERLRHKQRAVTLWDYEHLILQEFPYIYKANCLNHTSLNSPLSPGNVTVVVIPNIIQKNVYDSYKPRISKAKRNEIKEFINKLNTLHVTAEVINPVYEEIKVVLKVKFREGFDDNFYTLELQKDIAKLFSPWAFEETTTIDFGVTLHESMVINYIEQLGYVDYISDFQLQQENGTTPEGEIIYKDVNKVVPSSAKVILTSVKFAQHDVVAITPAETCTKKEKSTA